MSNITSQDYYEELCKDSKLKGKWVAIKDGKLIATADTYKTLLSGAGVSNPEELAALFIDCVGVNKKDLRI